MSKLNQTAEKAVYDALCVVPNEVTADTSKTKLKSHIRDHAAEPGLSDVIQAYGLVNVRRTALLLHKRAVFSSQKIAQEYFQAALHGAEGSSDIALCDPASADKEIHLSNETRVPLSAQHHLLAKVQVELEAACFEFAKANMPAVLQENDWTCAEAAELNRIARALGKNWEQLPGVARLSTGVTASQLLAAMESIRHAAVHREYLNAKDLLAMLSDSESLLILFKNENRLLSMRSLREKVNKCVIELNQDEAIFKESIVTAHNDAAVKIARLKQQEDEAVARAESRRAAFHRSYAEEITAMVSGFHVKEASQIWQPSSRAAVATVMLFFARSMRSATILIFGIVCRLYAVLAELLI